MPIDGLVSCTNIDHPLALRSSSGWFLLTVSRVHIRTFKRVTRILYKEEKSLRHVAMVAKFLDDNKPKTSFKRWIRTVSNFIDLIQFPSICQMLAKFSGSEKTVSKLRKRTFLCCVRSLHKAGAWNLQKTGQAYPQDSINKLIIWKMNRLVVPVTGVKSTCVMISEYFTRTSLYLVRLKIWMD